MLRFRWSGLTCLAKSVPSEAKKSKKMPNQAAFVDKSPRHWSGLFRDCRAASGGVVLEWRKTSADRSPWSWCEPLSHTQGARDFVRLILTPLQIIRVASKATKVLMTGQLMAAPDIRVALVFNSCGSSLPEPNSRLGAELKIRERPLTRTLKGEPCPGLASHSIWSSRTAALSRDRAHKVSLRQPEFGRVVREEFKAIPVGGVRPPQRAERQPLQQSDPMPKTTQSEGS